jgi:hypothetical protein
MLLRVPDTLDIVKVVIAIGGFMHGGKERITDHCGMLIHKLVPKL